MGNSLQELAIAMALRNTLIRNFVLPAFRQPVRRQPAIPITPSIPSILKFAPQPLFNRPPGAWRGVFFALLLQLPLAAGIQAKQAQGQGPAQGQVPAQVLGQKGIQPRDQAKDPRTAVLAGGCFWGMEAVFEHVKGVLSVESGYAGGTSNNPSYGEVSSGQTGHAEAVRILYDPKRVSYDQLLAVFLTVAHNPTERNRQGPDVGSQYRSAIFFLDDHQNGPPPGP
jgi:peptide-methionine (S)-S-oxide reductase